MIATETSATLSPVRNLSILLIRMGAVRDVLKTSAAAPALRARFPGARLTWATDAFTAPLARANPYVDEVVAVDGLGKWPRPWRPGELFALAREYHAFFRALRARRFDVAIDFTGTPASALLARLAGAAHRIGPEASSRLSRWCYSEVVRQPATPVRFTQHDLTLLTALNVPLEPTRPVLEIPADEAEAARGVLAALGWNGEAYLACCPAPSRACKGWSSTRWGELADLLWQRLKLRTVFIGGPERRADILRMVEGRASRPISVAGRTTLLQSAALAQGAALVIGCDAGLTYAGFATDTPTVVLHGPTDPSHLLNEPAVALCFHPLPCAPCRHPSCKQFDCMAAITTAEVADTAEKLLERAVSRAS